MTCNARLSSVRSTSSRAEQDSRPAEHGVERGADLVRQRREEFVFRAQRFLGDRARQLLRLDLLAQHALTGQPVADVLDDGDRADEDRRSASGPMRPLCGI